MEVREPIVKKAYYSIGEVCDLTGLKPHVLRYWESQFDVLRPTKNRAGNRVFRPKDVELVLLVKNLLYGQKYTIQGANQKLLEMRKEGKLEEGQQEILEPEFLATMSEELEDLAKILDPMEPLEDFAGSSREGEESPGEDEEKDTAQGVQEAEGVGEGAAVEGHGAEGQGAEGQDAEGQDAEGQDAEGQDAEGWTPDAPELDLR